MADIKLSEVPVLTTMAAGDYIPFTSDPAGTPATKSITKANLFTSPALVTPALGTPASGVLTNCTGLPAAGIVPGTAENDFLVATTTPFAWVKKTLAEVKTILGLASNVPAATAESDFIVSGATPFAWAKKTLAEAKALLGIDDKSPIASPTFTGLVTTPAIKITTGAGANKVLTSDADGDATWETPSTTFATAAEVNTGTEPAKAIAPDQAALALVGAASTLTDNALVRGDGGARKVQTSTPLVSDNGEMTNPSQPAFLAYSSLQSNVTGDGTSYTVQFTNEVFDQNSDFDGTSTFTAPVTGRYFLFSILRLSGLSSDHTVMAIDIITSNKTHEPTYVNAWAVCNQANGTVALISSQEVDMDAADTAILSFYVSGTNKTVDVVATYSEFGGFLIC